MTRYIIDIPTHRVIFFTEDPTVRLTIGPMAVLFEDHNQPPAGMTLSNAWTWQLVGRVFYKQEAEKTVEEAPDTLEENKNFVKKLLLDQINHARQSLNTGLNFDWQTTYFQINDFNDTSKTFWNQMSRTQNKSIEQIQTELLEKNERIKEVLYRTELWYQYYSRKIEESNSVENLSIVRDEIGSQNFNVDLF